MNLIVLVVLEIYLISKKLSEIFYVGKNSFKMMWYNLNFKNYCVKCFDCVFLCFIVLFINV